MKRPITQWKTGEWVWRDSSQKEKLIWLLRMKECTISFRIGKMQIKTFYFSDWQKSRSVMMLCVDEAVGKWTLSYVAGGNVATSLKRTNARRPWPNNSTSRNLSYTYVQHTHRKSGLRKVIRYSTWPGWPMQPSSQEQRTSVSLHWPSRSQEKGKQREHRWCRCCGWGVPELGVWRGASRRFMIVGSVPGPEGREEGERLSRGRWGDKRLKTTRKPTDGRPVK